jgi:rubrerythrin
MTVEKETPQSSMFCRQCGYQLVGLSENRCPECGRAFD